MALALAQALCGCGGWIRCLALPVGQVVPGSEGIDVVGAQETGSGAREVAVVVPGGGDLAGPAEAVAHPVQHGMGVGPVELFFGVGGQGGGVGAQGLDQGGVAVDVGPER